MIQFKAKTDTVPSKLASAIAHNITNSDIEISCLGAEAVNASIKALVIAKKFTQNKNFNLKFDFFQLEGTDENNRIYNFIKIVVSKNYH